jgi:L-seryl-tRNA(Ser) seleniumtransferase
MTLAALEATLRLYLNEERALREVPGLCMLGTPLGHLRQRAEQLAERLRTLAEVKVCEDVAFVGGGSLPDQQLRTWVVEVTPTGMSDTDFAYRLRVGTPAVVGRVRDGKLILDVRTLLPGQEDALLEAVRKAFS